MHPAPKSSVGTEGGRLIDTRVGGDLLLDSFLQKGQRDLPRYFWRQTVQKPCERSDAVDPFSSTRTSWVEWQAKDTGGFRIAFFSCMPTFLGQVGLRAAPAIHACVGVGFGAMWLGSNV